MRRHPSPSRGVRARASSGGYGAKSSKISLVVSIVVTACALIGLVRSGTRANEANEALQRAMSEVATYEHRVETLERELRSAEAVKEAATKTEATLRETREALDEAKREAAQSNAEAARAKMRAEDVETEAMLEKARGVTEGLEALGGGDAAKRPAPGDAEDVFGEKATRDAKDAASVVSGKNGPARVEEDEDDVTTDEAPSAVRSKAESATFSDPLLLNLAAPKRDATKDADMTCNGKENTELWGAVVRDGNGNTQPDAAACCASCAKMNENSANRCSVWVYGEKSKACWLKYDENPSALKPAAEGAHVEWTSGWFDLPKNNVEPKYKPATGKTDLPKCLHTIMTTNGNVYMNWQSRIMYSSYLKHAAEPGGIMKAFTRILHRGRDDELMHEIPTMRVNPVQTKCDGWCDYPVADRSKAVSDWLLTADSERCSHVVMVETDHIIVKSPSPEILLPQGQGMGFKFGYMDPQQRTLKKLYPQYFENGAKMPPTGNSPAVVNTIDLRKIAPLWAQFVNETETPESVRKELGWVRDMYAYDLAALAAGVEHVLEASPKSLLLAQPPADMELGEAYILHYTWGSEIYDKNEKFIWKFDKRSYGEGQYQDGPMMLSEIPPPPKWDADRGLQLQTFFAPRKLTESRLGLIKKLIDEFNMAVRALPKIPTGFKTIEEARAFV